MFELDLLKKIELQIPHELLCTAGIPIHVEESQQVGLCFNAFFR